MKNILIIIIAVSIIAFFFMDWKKPVDANKTAQAVTWLSNYYKNYPIGGNWAVLGVTSNSNVIKVSITVPDYTASSIMKLGFKEQQKILSVACPNQYEKIWGIIHKNHSIKAEFKGAVGDVFSKTFCKRSS